MGRTPKLPHVRVERLAPGDREDDDAKDREPAQPV